MDTSNLKNYFRSLQLQEQHLQDELKELDELIHIFEALENDEANKESQTETTDQSTPKVNGPAINIKFSNEMESKINDVLSIAKISGDDVYELPKKKPASEVLREAKQAELDKAEQAKLTKQARLQQLEKAYLKNAKTKKSVFTKNSDKITNQKFKTKPESKKELPIITQKPAKETIKTPSLQTLYPSKPEPLVEIVIEKPKETDFETILKKKLGHFTLETRHITKANLIKKVVAQNEKAIARPIVLPGENSKARFLLSLTLHSFFDAPMNSQLIQPVPGLVIPNDTVLNAASFVDFLFKYSELDRLIRFMPKSGFDAFLSKDAMRKGTPQISVKKLSLYASFYKLFACLYELTRQLSPSGAKIKLHSEANHLTRCSIEFWRERVENDIKKFLENPFSSDGRDRELFEILGQVRLLCYYLTGKNSLFLINS